MEPIEPKWGLTDEEIHILYKRDLENGITFKDYLKVGSQATLRHVYEEGEKPCPHTEKSFELPFGIPKRECHKCWAELRKEAGL